MTGRNVTAPAWPPNPGGRWAEPGDAGVPPPPVQTVSGPRVAPGWVLGTQLPSRWPGTGTLIRRTATVLVSAPRTFLAIAAIGAIPGLVGLLIPQPTAGIGGIGVGFVIVTVGLALLGVIWGTVTGVMTTTATAEVAMGRRPRLRDLFSDLDRPVIATLVASIILVLLAVVVLVAFGLAIVGSAFTGLGAVAIIGVILAPVGVVVGAVAVLRCSLILPAIVLETQGSVNGIRRSVDVTRGLSWHLFGLWIAWGMGLGLPILAIEASATLASPTLGRVLAIVVAGAVAPILPVALAILFGHLVGRPWTLPNRVPHAVGFTVTAAAIGLLALAGVSAVALTSSPLFTYMTDPSHGQVQFGRSAVPAGAGCHVGGRSSTFGSQQPVFVSAVLLAPIGSGVPATIELSRNGVVIDSRAIATTTFTSCYVPTAPLTNLAPGAYRVTIREQQFVLADGTFTISGGTSATGTS
jgi:hypothetical protein